MKELAVNMNIYILELKLTLNLGSKVQNFGHNIQQGGGRRPYAGEGGGALSQAHSIFPIHIPIIHYNKILLDLRPQ